MLSARIGAIPKQREEDDPILMVLPQLSSLKSIFIVPQIHAFGLEFSNPVGLAAGFDKHAEALPGATFSGEELLMRIHKVCSPQVLDSWKLVALRRALSLVTHGLAYFDLLKIVL